jgi:hypothetical protein
MPAHKDQHTYNKIKVELCTFYSAEVTALHSDLVSHHCR